mmetsp:Transcript_81174/g.263055  ORF Transcript_81174/g.263055 Transcript_81174/m.263055 type:complete len:248 (+) Transcript_81174:903-1646(+)
MHRHRARPWVCPLARPQAPLHSARRPSPRICPAAAAPRVLARGRRPPPDLAAKEAARRSYALFATRAGSVCLAPPSAPRAPAALSRRRAAHLWASPLCSGGDSPTVAAMELRPRIRRARSLARDPSLPPMLLCVRRIRTVASVAPPTATVVLAGRSRPWLCGGSAPHRQASRRRLGGGTPGTPTSSSTVATLRRDRLLRCGRRRNRSSRGAVRPAAAAAAAELAPRRPPPTASRPTRRPRRAAACGS